MLEIYFPPSMKNVGVCNTVRSLATVGQRRENMACFFLSLKNLFGTYTKHTMTKNLKPSFPFVINKKGFELEMKKSVHFAFYFFKAPVHNAMLLKNTALKARQ